MIHRVATLADIPLLAALNLQLIRDEGHRNRMNEAELAARMQGWLASGEYIAVLFEDAGAVVAYALYRQQSVEIYLRQLYVVPQRRRQGVGRHVMQVLRDHIWPPDRRLTLEVLAANTRALAFYRALGYVDYAVTMEIMPPSSAAF